MAVMKLMTNILPAYYAFIEDEAERQGKTKRDIIEEAVALYIKDKKKQEILKSYEVMATDSQYLDEMTQMAEEGMDYFLTNIDGR